MTIDIASPGGNEAALEAALALRLPPARLPMRSGRTYGGMNVRLIAATPDYPSGYISALPIHIPNAITVASLSLYVETAADATTQTARLGIAADNNGIPSQTLLAEGAEIDLTLGSIHTVTLTGAAAAAGWYWLLIFMSDPLGGAETGAVLNCIDKDQPVETFFHLGSLNANKVLNVALYSQDLVLLSIGSGVYTDYASLQAALTAIGPVSDPDSSSYFFPAIALTVA